MEGISSDKQAAYQYATDIFLALDALTAANTVQEDHQTTVAGNTNAKEAIQLAKATVQEVVGAVGTASNNLKSVANEFEAADATIRKVMQTPANQGSPRPSGIKLPYTGILSGGN